MSQSGSTQNDALPLQSPDAQPTTSLSPTSRIPYRREKSWTTEHTDYHHVYSEDHDISDTDENVFDERSHPQGLGLSNVPQSIGATVVKRKPIAFAATPEFFTPSDHLSQATTPQNSGNPTYTQDAGKWTPASSRFSLHDSPYKHTSDNVHLIPRDRGHSHGYAHAHHGPEGCPTQGDVLREKWTWFTIMVVVFAVYSWVFSAIFLVLAILRPRWGHRVGPRGALTYDAATLLSALLSKLVELSFATTFVATLGQILSRRAFVTNARPDKRGVSIAEMNMRLWIMQPGTLVTHFEGVKYVVTSILGITALIAAFSATFYTTAAEALVSPKLKFGANETQTIFGQVSASYANSLFLADTCQTPISNTTDPEFGGTTCLQIGYAGNGFRDFRSWMSSWKEIQSNTGNMGAVGTLPRPPPASILFQNTTVQGQWIHPSGENITLDSERYGRYVQNATVVMPHANVFHAAREPTNRILQPNDLQGAGQYYLQAAVPAPGVNALCVGVSEAEISPLIGNGSGIAPPGWPDVSTPIDGLFNWTQNWDKMTTYPHPWFGKLPIEFNTVGNQSVLWGIPWVYLLAKPPKTTITNDYIVCGIRSFQYSDCSTSLYVSSSGSDLAVHCGNDPHKWKSYAQTVNATQEPLPTAVESKDWMDIGKEWVRSIALTHGISDSNASSARLVTQMIPEYSPTTPTTLSPSHPSIAEALCVLSGYTLLLASDASPFVHSWDYNPGLPPKLDVPALESFQAILSYTDYASGGDQQWKGVFYVVLAAVFILNTFCLGCLLYYYGLYGEVTDYTEPQNLFALAINSPPSQILAGTCGSGPTGQALGKRWCVDMSRPSETPPLDAEHSTTAYMGAGANDAATAQTHGDGHRHAQPHFFVRYPEEDPLMADADNTAEEDEPTTHSHRKRISTWFSPDVGRRKSMHRVSTVAQFDVDDSPAVAQYMKLSRRQ